ncbi:MAG: GTP pyrophosphokinase [Verrucomicrobiota bacterium]
MTKESTQNWISNELPRYKRLTSTVRNIIENLLKNSEIDFLTVEGRTKKSESIEEKVRRKNYADISAQMTDISGIRVVTYFESQVAAVCSRLEDWLTIDESNSLNKEQMLSVNEFGYRSVHYVCSLGTKRKELAEYSEIADLKFEIQVRTVLQHAWAELAHDRNYKFRGKLPKNLERELFLYSGMLELADKGFDNLVEQIDEYSKQVEHSAKEGHLNIAIDSISLEAFLKNWAKNNEIVIGEAFAKPSLEELVGELQRFGVTKLSELQDIIHNDYSTAFKELDARTTMYGLVRDWMLIEDYKRYQKDAWNENWHGFGDSETEQEKDLEIIRRILGDAEADDIKRIFGFRWDEEGPHLSFESTD